jgi:hypothetical protein
MSAAHPAHRVEARCVGAPPAHQIERAAGVSEVETDGPVVRCLVACSFQPFLEALRGYEVISLQSTFVTESQSSRSESESSPSVDGRHR